MISTSFNSAINPFSSSWKPSEPSPTPPTLSVLIDVPKIFCRGPATSLVYSNYKVNATQEQNITINCYFYTRAKQTNLPRPLSASEREFSGLFKFERLSKSSVAPLQESSQFSKYNSAKGEHLSVASII